MWWRYNQTTHIFETSTNDGGTWAAPTLEASVINSGQIGMARGGTGVDLSATGGATKVLAQDASHVISARDLIAADIPNLAASKITSGQLALARGGSNADLSATGGTSQVVKQVSAGAAFTVGQLAITDISGMTLGTWTPVLGGDGGTSGQTYSTQIGRYFKIGSLVVAIYRVTLSNKGTITGSLWMQGFPFTSNSTAAFLQGMDCYEFTAFNTSWTRIRLRMEINSTNAYAMATAGVAINDVNFLTGADITNLTSLIGTMVYVTD